MFDLALSVLLMLLALIEKPAVFGTDSDEKPIVTVRLRLSVVPEQNSCVHHREF